MVMTSWWMVDGDKTLGMVTRSWWCWQFDWEGLLNRTIPAPITFSLKGEDDTVRASSLFLRLHLEHRVANGKRGWPTLQTGDRMPACLMPA